MLCFFAWGTEISGGVQSLIINLSTYFAEQKRPVTIIGYDYCYIVKKLNDQNIDYHYININKITDEQLEQKLKGKVLIITSFHSRFGLKKIYRANPNVLFWNVFPTGIININKIGPINLKFLTSKLINYMFQNEGCVFMDGYGYDETVNFNKKANLVEGRGIFLPIPLKTDLKNVYIENNKTKNDNEFNISYVGRATVWKIYPLIKFIDDLKKIKSDLFINIFIISQEKELYYEMLNNIDLPRNFKIIYKSKLAGLQYFDFLKSNIDLHVAMGTAALDGASIGIPTILIDYSFSKMPEDYNYKWLFETPEFGLGDNAHTVKNIHPLKTMIKPFINNDKIQIEEISQFCNNYVRLEHSIENIAPKLIYYAKKTTSQARILYKYTPLVNNTWILSFINLYNKTLNKRRARANT
jgi:hypothetical protein